MSKIATARKEGGECKAKNCRRASDCKKWEAKEGPTFGGRWQKKMFEDEDKTNNEEMEGKREKKSPGEITGALLQQGRERRSLGFRRKANSNRSLSVFFALDKGKETHIGMTGH